MFKEAEYARKAQNYFTKCGNHKIHTKNNLEVVTIFVTYCNQNVYSMGS